MPKARLTSLSVERLRPPKNGRLEYWDTTLPGFGLRVSHTGGKTWVLMYRVNGRRRRQTVGRYPALKLAKAREKACAALDQVDKGQDPGARRQRLEAAAADTFNGTADLFLEGYARRHQRNPERTEYLLERYVRPELGARKLESVTRGDIALLVDGIAAKGAETKANRVPLSSLAQGVVEDVPAIEGVDLLFSSRRGDDRPVSGFSKAKRELDIASGVTDWRLHDLRRTMASGLARLGTAPHVVEAILNDRSGTISGVAAVYNRYEYAAEKREALEAWATHIKALTTDNVVRLRETAQ